MYPAQTNLPYKFVEHCKNQNSIVNFPPISLVKPGQYMMWIQAKSEGEIITQKFDFEIVHD